MHKRVYFIAGSTRDVCFMHYTSVAILSSASMRACSTVVPNGVIR